MKRLTRWTLLAVLVCFSFDSANARPLPERSFSSNPRAEILSEAQVSARSDSFFLFAAEGPGAYGMPGTTERGYSFDWLNPGTRQMEGAPAGWYGVDESAQDGFWWHLADVALCAGSDTDMSAALPFDYPTDPENSYAAWCGREEVCGWEHPSGYGNGWDQWMRVHLDASSSLDVLFDYAADFEGREFDCFQVFVEVDGELEEFLYDNTEGPSGFLSREVLAEGNLGDLIFSFHSDEAWSDEDGLYDTNIGAVWIDNIVILADGRQVFAADFEDGLDPAAIEYTGKAGAGDFAAINEQLPDFFPSGLVDGSYAWTFFDSLTLNPYYDMHPVIPYGPPYVEDRVVSPVLTTNQYGAQLGTDFQIDSDTSVLADFWVYLYPMGGEDLIFQSTEFAARPVGQDCFGPWVKYDWWYWEPGWRHVTIDITEFLMESSGGAAVDAVAAGLGVVDMCPYWCDVNGSGENHPPGPFYDNVSIYTVQEPSDIDEAAPVTRLLGIHPNPFNPKTTVSFALARAGRLEVHIYDLGGRRVRRLWDGLQAAGSHELEWDGTDDRGRQLASGVYFLRFRAGEYACNQKLVLLK